MKILRIQTIARTIRERVRLWVSRYIIRIGVLEAVALLIFIFVAREQLSFVGGAIFMAAILGIAIGTRMLAVVAATLLIMGAITYEHTNSTLAEYYIRSAYYLFLLIIMRECAGLLVVSVKKLARFADRIRALEQYVYHAITNRILIITQAVFVWIRSIPAQLYVRYRDGRLWVAITTIALAIVPFFWFEGGNGDFGGDSSRLYFYDPLNWLKSMGLYEINPNGYGIDNPNFFMVPFLGFLHLIKSMVRPLNIPLLSVFNGVLLSGAFLSVYAVVLELLHRAEDKKSARIAAIVSGLLFICSQIVGYGWQKSIHSFHQIALYPLMFWFFLRFINRKNIGYIVAALFVTVLFSVNFSLVGVPTFFAFFPAAILWLMVYALIERRAIMFIGGLVFFTVAFIGLHAFHLYPQLTSIFNPENTIHQNIFTEEGKINRGLAYFDGVRHMVEPIYNLVGFHQYGLYTKTSASEQLLSMLRIYGVHIIFLFFAFPLVIVGALWIRAKDALNTQKTVFIMLVAWFLIMLYFMTASFFGAPGVAFYRSLFSVPGFSIFRSFYGVFAIPFMLVYAWTFGVAMYMVYTRITRRTVRGFLVGGLSLLLIYGAIPMFTGKVVNVVMNDTKGVSLANRFNNDFELILEKIRTQPLAAKILAVPLVGADYQIIDGADGGAYVGPSPISLLAGKHVFAGLQAFDFGKSVIFNQSFFLDAVARRDYRTVGRLLSLMNVGFMFHNENPAVYRDKFIGWPYSKELWQVFPTTQSFTELSKELGYQLWERVGTYSMYHNPVMMQPRIFVPDRVEVVASEVQFQDMIVRSPDWSPRWAVFEEERVRDKIPALSAGRVSAPPSIEFSQINSTQYQIVIRNIRQSFPLVFTQAYHHGWQLYPGALPEKCQNSEHESVVRDDPTGASEAQKERWCAGGRISVAGNEYISQEYHGTIQNQNLSQDLAPIPVAFNNAQHMSVNTYANAWWIGMDDYPRDLVRKNQDGSSDIAFTLAFAPQRNFYKGIIISLSSSAILLVFFVGYLVFTRWRKRKHR